MTGRRAARREENRARILDAALAAFAQNGFAATRMEEIARAAGLTKPTLYQYFDGKEALFTAMMQAPGEGMLAEIDLDSAEDPIAQLWAFAWRYAKTVMDPAYLSLARLVIGEAQRFPEIGRTYQAAGPDKVLAGLTDFMARQAAAGTLLIDDPEMAAHDFWGLILSAPRNKALHRPDALPKRKEVTRYVQNGMRVFLRAYSAHPETALRKLSRLKPPSSYR